MTCYTYGVYKNLERTIFELWDIETIDKHVKHESREIWGDFFSLELDHFCILESISSHLDPIFIETHTNQGLTFGINRNHFWNQRVNPNVLIAAIEFCFHDVILTWISFNTLNFVESRRWSFWLNLTHHELDSSTESTPHTKKMACSHVTLINFTLYARIQFVMMSMASDRYVHRTRWSISIHCACARLSHLPVFLFPTPLFIFTTHWHIVVALVLLFISSQVNVFLLFFIRSTVDCINVC